VFDSKFFYAEVWNFYDKLLENRRRDVINLNQPRDMSVKMAANGIQIHARTNQGHTLAYGRGNP